MKNILVFAGFLLFAYACQSPQQETPVEKDKGEITIAIETLQMIDSIQAIKQRTAFRKHPYESSEKLKLVEQELKTARANQNLPVQLYIEYGKVLLDAGRTQDAIDVFEEILTKMPENKVVNATTKGLHEALAVSYLRLGEQTNCIENHSSEACLFPIKGKGIHTNKEGSQKAIAIYAKILQVFPDDLRSRWLLNLAYMTLGEYPAQVPAPYLIAPEAFKSEYNLSPYENIAMNIGLDVNDLAGGVILDDFNQDGWLDIMASSWSMQGQIRYFISQGNGQFTDKTKEAGLEGLTGGLNLIQADFNNDGHLDFYVIRGAWRGLKWMGQLPNSLVKNNGDGTFTDVTIAAGLYGEHPTQSAVWLDFNADGWLDLFVGNETHTDKELHPCQLFLNQKDGTFIDVADQLGLTLNQYVKGTAAGDINNDGLPDLYLSVLTGPNHLFVNRRGNNLEDWKFEDVTQQAGVSEPLESFPTWFFDYDNDGWEDIFVACFDLYSLKQQSREVAADYLGLPSNSDWPRLYRNQGGEGFSNITKEAKLDRILPTMGCNYGDLDNDGFLDFYLGTGAPDYRAVVPNRMFRNQAGQYFQDVTSTGNFGHIQKGHGIGFADLDNDGDQDIYAVMGGSLSGDIFQNALFENPGNDHKWITIRLKGTTSNRLAIGARLKISVENEDGTQRAIYRTVSSGGSFGANSLQQEIGLGIGGNIKNIAVNWPNGRFEWIDYGPIEANQVIKIEEGMKAIITLDKRSFSFAKMDHEGELHH